MRKITLTGKRFGRLVVVSEAGNNKHGQSLWTCVCDCGTSKEILGYNLRQGHSQSCGCAQVEAARRNVVAAHLGENNGRARSAKKRAGEHYVSSKDDWYRRCAGRFYEAKADGVPVGFATVHEFASYCRSIAPDRCPILGIELIRGCREKKHNPSIDRIVPEVGYVAGNIQIISNKANMMKNSATREELVAFAKWVLK